MDTISRISGDFGVWQLRTILIIFLYKIPSSWFMACIIFTAPQPYNNEYWCSRNNRSSSMKCSYENPNDGNALIPCTEFTYDDSEFYSLNMQFDLVCDRDVFVAWSQYWHLFGVLVGGITATIMMIFISPRRVMLVGIIAQIICGCLTGYIDNFTVNCLLRCLCAVCCALMFTSGQTIFTEITGGIYKIGAIILYDTFWSIGVIILSLFSTYFISWNHIYLGISLPTCIMFILYYWIPEAPRWLLRRRRYKEVEKILLNAAAINDRKHFIPENLLNQLMDDASNLQPEDPIFNWTVWLDLWKGHRATINFIGAHIALAVYITNFNGMLLNIRSFGREYLKINSIITVLSEIVGCFIALHIAIHYNKHKWIVAGLLNVITGLIGCTGWFFSDSLDKITRISLWMLISSLPKACVSVSQSMLLACLPELVVPSKRPAFMFTCVVWARIWLLTAPFINIFRKIDTALSLSFFCILGLIGGIATCCLKIPSNINNNGNSNIIYNKPNLTKSDSFNMDGGIDNLAHHDD